MIGEILKKQEAIKYDNEPDYIKVYLDAIMFLSEMPQGISDVMKCILKRVPWANANDQRIVLTKPIKESIAADIGKSEKYVSDSISTLTKGKLLFRVGSVRSACYLVNPHIFGRGSWEDVKKAQLQINFDFEKCEKTFWAEVQKSKNGETITEMMERKAIELK